MDLNIVQGFGDFIQQKKQEQPIQPENLQPQQEQNIVQGFGDFIQQKSPNQEQKNTVPQPVQNNIEAHRPQNVDDNTWEDIKNRVGEYLHTGEKFIAEHTPIMSVPKMVAETAFTINQDISKAKELKGLETNYQFAFKDLKDTYNAAINGDEEAAKRLKEKQDLVNENTVKALRANGIEAYYDNGELLVKAKDENGKPIFKKLDEDTFSNIASGMSASGGEIAGGIGGAVRGGEIGLRLGATPQTKAVGTAVGALAGGYLGTLGGSLFDLTRASLELNHKIDAYNLLNKATARGAADTITAVGSGAIAKTVSKPATMALDKIVTLMKQGQLKSAREIVKKDYGLTDGDIEKLYDSVRKDVNPDSMLTGDDLERAKLSAVIQQQKQGLPYMINAVKESPLAALRTSQEIDRRAENVIKTSKSNSLNPKQLQKAMADYERSVQKNYSEVKDLISEALPNYKPKLNLSTFSKTIEDVNNRVIEPHIKENIQSFADSLSHQKVKNVDDLIEVRKLYNNFYGKNAKYFTNKKDKEALHSIKEAIDGKLDEALNTLPKDVKSGLEDAFNDANKKYTEMYKTRDTATFNSIFDNTAKTFKKGVSEDAIGKALVKYAKSEDGDLDTLLNKLKPLQRTKAEFSVINQVLKSTTSKSEAKAIDFKQFLGNIKEMKNTFKSPETKQFIKNIELYDKKFGKDVELQKAASGVSEKYDTTIAMSVRGKAKQITAKKVIHALQRLFPFTDRGKRLSLQKAIEMALEKSRTPREFIFNASKIKELPNNDRNYLKKAVKEIGEQQKALKEQELKQQEKQRLKEIEKQKLKEKTVKKTEAKARANWDKAVSKKAAQMKKKKLNSRQEEIQSAKEIPIGGSEDEAKHNVKNLFKKNTSEEARYKNMSKDDIAYLEEQHKKEMSKKDWDEANQVFAKGIDNLAAGTIAGIGQDQNGNITFDPEKFIIGLGGYTAVKAALKSGAVRGKLKDYAKRAIDYVDMNPQVHKGRGFNAMYVGSKGNEIGSLSDTATKKTMKEIDDSGAKFKIIPKQKVEYEGREYEQNYANLSEILDHPELFKKYPELKNIQVSINDKYGKGGSYNSAINSIALNKGNTEKIENEAIKNIRKKIRYLDKNPIDNEYKKLSEELTNPNTPYEELMKINESLDKTPTVKKITSLETKLFKAIDDANKKGGVVLNEEGKQTLLHEIQHAIQDKEGWARGGSPEDFKREVDNYRKIDKAIDKIDDFIGYNKWFKDNIDKIPALLKTQKGKHNQDFLRNEFAKTLDSVASKKYLSKLKEARQIQKENKKLVGLKNGEFPKPFEAYKQLWGEQQARATAHRVSMSPKKRMSKSMWDTLKEKEGEVPNSLIKYDTKGEQQSAKEPLHIDDKITREKNFKNWFKGSKIVDDKGKPLIVYHGTGSNIKEFKTSFVGKGNDQLGTGFYFAKNPKDSDIYAGGIYKGNNPNVVPVYLRMKKPLKVDDIKGEAVNGTTISKEQIKQLIKSSPNYKYIINDFGDVGYLGENKVLNDAVNTYHEMDDFNIMNTINNDFYQGEEPIFIKNFEKITGFDGVEGIRKTGNHYVVFNPKNIKSIHNKGTFDKSSSNILQANPLTTIGAVAGAAAASRHKQKKEKKNTKFLRNVLYDNRLKNILLNK